MIDQPTPARDVDPAETTPATQADLDRLLACARRSAVRLTRMVLAMAVVLVLSLAATGYLLLENGQRVDDIQEGRYESVVLRCLDDNQLKRVIRVLVPPGYPPLEQEPARSYLVVEGDCEAFARKRLALPQD